MEERTCSLQGGQQTKSRLAGVSRCMQDILTVLHKLVCQFVLLGHESEAQGRAVSDLVIHVIEAAREQDLHAALDLGVLLADAELGQSRHSRGTYDGVFEHHAVVDVSDVLGRLGRLGSLSAQEVENADGELGEFAVLDEFAEVCQGIFLGVGNELDQVEHALYDSTLEFVATFVAQDAAEELEHAGLLAGELEAERTDGLHDGDLELVRNLRHEARDLLHQAIDACLVAGLEEGGDRERGNRAVAVRDEELDVGVANAHGLGLERGNAVEDAEGGELGNGAGGGEEELENADCLGDLGVGDVPHVADRPGGFEVDHLALVPQPAIQKLHHGSSELRILLGELGSEAHQHDDGGGALHGTGGTELLDHLDQRHPVVHSHLIEQADGVVLAHGRVVHRNSAGGGREAEREAAGRLGASRRFLGLALPPLDDVLGNREEMVGRHEGRGRNRGVLVDNSRLHDSFDRLHGRGLVPC